MLSHLTNRPNQLSRKRFLMSLSDAGNRRILITNDDGIDAEGLRVLARIADRLSDDVWTCAPINEESGVGHAITLHRPLRVRKLADQIFTVDGTPSDCVLLAINDLIHDRKPDLVLSGVNHGANIGDDVTYSGTIGATMEATLLGIPAIALSLELGEGEANWASVEAHAPSIIETLVGQDWPKETLISVNFPDCPTDAVKGIRVLRHGTRKIGDEITHHRDPRGRSYTWIGPARRHAIDPDENTDVTAVYDGYITITPLRLDLTNYDALALLDQAFAASTTDTMAVS
jgi:5'-nucleotidase